MFCGNQLPKRLMIVCVKSSLETKLYFVSCSGRVIMHVSKWKAVGILKSRKPDLNKASLPQTWHKTFFFKYTHTHTHIHTHTHFCCGPFYLKILLDSFLMWTIFKVFIEFVIILFLFYVLVFWPWGMWDPGSQTRGRTHTPCTGKWSLHHGLPRKSFFFSWIVSQYLSWEQSSVECGLGSATLQSIFMFICSLILGTGRCYYPDFTDVETVAHRGLITCPESRNWVQSGARFKSSSQHDASHGAEYLESWTLETCEDMARLKFNQETFRSSY